MAQPGLANTRTQTDLSRPVQVDPFVNEAQATLMELRSAVAAVLAACGGIDRAVDVANRLGLDNSLAWKIWQVGRDHGGLPSPAHICGRSGFERFLTAAEQSGIASDLVHRARSAFDGFERLMRRHAGDRATADRLLGHISGEGKRRLDTAIRRDGFRANSYLLGIQAASTYQLDAVVSGDRAFMPEIYRVRGHFGLQRNRADAPWILSRTTLVHETGPSATLCRGPIDGTSPALGNLLLTQFCSDPNLPIVRRVLPDSTVEDEIPEGPVGQQAAIDVVLGEHFSGMPRRDVSFDALVMRVLTPSERLVYDILLPEGQSPTEMELRVHSTVQTDLPYLRGETYAAIPVTEKFERLGPVLKAPEATEIPRQGAMIKWLVGKLPPHAQNSVLWRTHMRYPPVPSVLAARYPIAP